MQEELLARFGRYLVDLGFAAKAAALYADDLALDGHADGDWREWPDGRVQIAKQQLAMRWTNELLYPKTYRIDGLVGPGTEYAYEAYEFFEKYKKLPYWRDARENPDLFTMRRQKKDIFPKERDMIEFYGMPGKAIRDQMVKVHCPWTLKIAWDRAETRNFLWSHKKCADQLAEVLADVYDSYGLREISRLRLDIFSGDYNHRLKRGGSVWSTHALCIAWDFAHQWNKLKWDHEKALFAKPDYDEWWEAWERQGFVSLGREEDYDWMHVQAARLN